MDAITVAAIADEEHETTTGVRCWETCGFDCRGWCRAPFLLTRPEPAVAVEVPAPERSSPTRAGTITTTTAVQPVEEQRVSSVLFTAEALYVPNTPFTFFSGATRRRITGSWEDLTRFLSRSREGNPEKYPDPNIAKRARGAWVPGTYRGTAGHGNLSRDLVETGLLVIDIDHGDPHAVADALSAYDTIIHSTYKYTPSTPRCRGVFRLAAPCTSAADYNTGEKFIARALSARGFTVPAKDSTLGKLAYLPMHQPGIEPVVIVNRGKPLDLGRIVAAEKQHEQIERKRKPSRGQHSPTKTTAYAAGAVRRAVEAIASAPSGERHNTLFKEAASLARPELGLDEREILSTLRTAAGRADPEESVAEHERVIRDAIRKGRS